MRLLLISSEFPPGPGGIGNHAHQLAINLCRLGWEVLVVSPQDYVSSEEVAQFNARQPFRVMNVPSGRGRLRQALHRIRTANGLVREQPPDLVVGTGLSAVWVAAVVGTLSRLTMVAVAHGSEFGTSRLVPRIINRWAYRRPKAVIAVSEFTQGLVASAGIQPRRRAVIGNAADHRRFVVLPEAKRLAFRQKSGFQNACVLLTVGHVSERKGQDVVIRALPQILGASPATHYVMAGLPTLQPQLTRLADQLGVRDHVHFLGAVTDDDMVSWLNCADIFVMTSRTTRTGDCEGFGIAVVEAALCAKPAVVSRQSGLIEAIEEGVTGLAVPENNPEATADAVLALLSDGPRRHAMGEAALARALKEQTWDSCARRYDAILSEIAGNKS